MMKINNGNFLTWTSLNNQQLLKHQSPRIVTDLGSLDQERKNLQSTKKVKPELEIEEDRYFYLDLETVKAYELCATIIPFNIKRKYFSDLTRAFTHKSSRGNLYVIVMYGYSSNSIIDTSIPFDNNTGKD